jgi:hypothetical protein
VIGPVLDEVPPQPESAKARTAPIEKQDREGTQVVMGKAPCPKE